MHVIFRDEAIADLKDIWDFVAATSEEYADGVVERLIAAGLGLGDSPARHPVMIGFGSQELRRLTIRSWVIYYRVRTDWVDIVACFASARLPPAARH